MGNEKDEWSIYHNPRCSKSREALERLRASGVEPHIVEYLQTPPNARELRALLKKLDLPAVALLRRGEDAYKANYAGKELSEADAIAAMVAYPVLIERPIVVHGERAVVGRPPERVEQLLR